MSESYPAGRPLTSDFLLVRHGQTFWNIEGRYQGQTDTPLSPHGLEQAQALATGLAPRGIRTLISSPLQRARQTALPLSQHLGLDLLLDERLTEIDYGLWEGWTQVQIKARWPEALRLWKRRPDAYPPVGGEPLALAAERVRCCLDELAASCTKPLLLVTHAGVIRLALLLAAQIPLADFRKVEVPHAKMISLNWPPSHLP